MSLVETFTHLKGRPKSDDALPLLKRIASLVKPVMRKHDWKLPILAEFFPHDPSLVGLNMNRGQKVLLRLRPHNSPDSFYDEEQLVAVMLHELTHNVHGPHDEKFYKLLSDLETEYDTFKRSGYAGEGFHSEGKRLGVGVSHNLPPHLARAKALESAQKRRSLHSIMGNSGGQRLGGKSLRDTRDMSPRELAVQAAERRARDEKSCGTQRGQNAQEEADKAALESVEDKADSIENRASGSGSSLANEVALGLKTDLSGVDIPPVQVGWTCNVCTLENAHHAQKCLACLSARHTSEHPPTNISTRSTPNATSSRSVKQTGSNQSSSKIKLEQGDIGWNCPACTLFNPINFLQCSICLTTRPQKVREDGWMCMACGEDGMSHDFWSCRSCGRIKDNSAS